jgi:hypothetical protein
MSAAVIKEDTLCWSGIETKPIPRRFVAAPVKLKV